MDLAGFLVWIGVEQPDSNEAVLVETTSDGLPQLRSGVFTWPLPPSPPAPASALAPLANDLAMLAQGVVGQ